MKKTLLLFAMLLGVVGAWAQIEVSTSVKDPENTYSLLSKNGLYMSAGTGSTQFNIGRFAFFGGTDGAYKIYSVDKQKWVSYTKVDEYSGDGGADKATLIESQDDAQVWKVVKNGDYYNIAPYLTNGTVAGYYWNFFGGIGTYAYDNAKTVGLYNKNTDGGSLWKLEKLTLATEADVNTAKALIAVAPGYPKTTTTAYTKLNTLTTGAAITNKHVEVIVNAYKTESNVILPENGKAYTITAKFQDGKKYHLNYTAGNKLAVSSTTTASTFVCKELRTGVYAFITEDGHLLTWIGNKETGAYKEGNGGINGYSSYFATTFNTKSDWNEFTVKKNDTHQEQFGLLRLVARRKNNAFSSLIAEQGGRFDEASDANFYNATYTSGWILTEVEHTNTDNQNVALAKIDVKIAGYIFGTSAGQYYATINEEKVIDKTTIFETLDSKTTVDEINAFKTTFVLNMPEAGKFYTLKNDNYYITSGVSGGKIAMSTTKDASAIYYYDGKYLLAYKTGLYIGLNNKDWTFEAVGSTGISQITIIAAANGVPCKFNVKSADRWLHRTSAYVNRCTDNTCGNAHNWTLEEVTSLPVTISDAGYATFYAPVAVQANGVTANTVTVNGEWATLKEIEGGVIPANTGVILSGDAGAYNFEITTAEALEDKGALEGTVASSYISDDAYVLSMPTIDGVEQPVGLYKATKNKDNNTKWQNNGFKAYLPATQATAGARFFLFGSDDDTETVIESVEAENANVNAEIFDLAGRRVQGAQKGIFIVNGKKVVR